MRFIVLSFRSVLLGPLNQNLNPATDQSVVKQRKEEYTRTWRAQWEIGEIGHFENLRIQEFKLGDLEI